MLDEHKDALVQHATDAAAQSALMTGEIEVIRLNQAELTIGISDIIATMKSIDGSVNRLDRKMDDSIRTQGELAGSNKHLKSQNKGQFETLGAVDIRLTALESDKPKPIVTTTKGFIDVVMLLSSNRLVQVIIAVACLATVYGTFMLFGIDVTESSKIIPGAVNGK